jgi:hypothetical protein
MRLKRKDQSLNKRSHPKVQDAQWGALRGEYLKPRT